MIDLDVEKAESYRSLYRVRPLLYHIGDIRLWIPVRQDGIVLWIGYVLLFFMGCYIIPVIAWIIPLDRALIMVSGPLVAAYYSVKLDPAGKTVPRYLLDIGAFFLKPKYMIAWREVRFSEGKRRLHWMVWYGSRTGGDSS